jgi:hypothetical protein
MEGKAKASDAICAAKHALVRAAWKAKQKPLMVLSKHENDSSSSSPSSSTWSHQGGQT